MKPTTDRPLTTAPHDLTLHLVQRPGPVTDNVLGMLEGAARGYADGPCRGKVGRILLPGLAHTLGLKPRALEAELRRVLEHLQPALEAGSAVGTLELDGSELAILVSPATVDA